MVWLALIHLGVTVLVDEVDRLFVLGLDLRINNGYLVTGQHRDGKQEYVHKLIARRAGMDTSNEIDHKDRNTLNLTRNNLRPATHVQNLQNQSLRRTNKSGAKGVSWSKRHRKWHARITVNKKVISLGLFPDLEFARQIRQQAEKKYFGEFVNNGQT